MRSLAISAALLLSACHTVHTADFLATPADRLVCEAAGARPKIPAEYVPDWSKAEAAKDVPSAVGIAKGEFAKFVAVLRTREGIEVGYILDLEGKHYVC